MKENSKNLKYSSEVLRKHEQYSNKWAFKAAILISITTVIFYFYRVNIFGLLNSRGSKIAIGILYGILDPDLSLLFSISENGVPFLMLQTIAIAIAGTIFATLLAIPFSFLSSTRIMPQYIAALFSTIVIFIRTIPTLVWALIWIRVTGPGAFCGVITQSVASIGMISKLYVNAIDDLDISIIDSLDAIGFNRFQKIRYGIIPQLRANFISASIYRFEINLKDATTLGIVGAGGIGATLVQALNTGRWSMAGSFIFGFIALVILAEYISTLVRKSIH